jgi:hypothetical protein
MTTTTVYRLFGIPIWSVTRATSVADEEAVYQRMAARFDAEMTDALKRVRTPH